MTDYSWVAFFLVGIVGLFCALAVALETRGIGWRIVLVLLSLIFLYLLVESIIVIQAQMFAEGWVR
jgi:hypothetical protein